MNTKEVLEPIVELREPKPIRGFKTEGECTGREVGDGPMDGWMA